MNGLPKNLVLQATRVRTAVALVLLLLFMSAICWSWLFFNSPSFYELIVGIGLFGFCITVLVLSLCGPPKLELHRNHFIRVDQFKNATHDWTDVSMLRVFRDRAFVEQIIFYPVDVDGKQGFAKHFAWGRVKVQLDTFGWEATDFANYLNSFRERAINDAN